jgi:hypothetical protein
VAERFLLHILNIRNIKMENVREKSSRLHFVLDSGGDADCPAYLEYFLERALDFHPSAAGI